MRYRYLTADVFTDRVFGGNPLAVLPDARGLTTEQMQLVAREFNYSETTFVLPAEDPDHTRRVRIFTPAEELPFAGHPTIGTAHVLAARGEIGLQDPETRIVFEEGAGEVPVLVRSENGAPVSAQLSAPEAYSSAPCPVEAGVLADGLSLAPEDLHQDAQPAIVSAGLPHLLVPLASLDATGRARLREWLWQEHLAGSGATGLHLLTFETSQQDADVHVRMFAPMAGIAEDPATGSAATALAGWLAERRPESDGSFRWVVEQGLEMGRPSRLEIEADKRGGEVTAMRCGGTTVLVAEGEIEVPEPA